MTELALPKPRHGLASKIIDKGIIQSVRSVCPPGFATDQFCVAAVAEINQLPDDTNFHSVAMTLFNCAVVGLIPGAALGHSHFVTFKMNRNKPNEYRCCQLIIGYKGLLDLSFGNNFLKAVQPEVVLQGEDFTLERREFGPELHHEIPLGRDLQYANVLAAYCTYQTHNGGCGITVVERSELDQLSKRWTKNGLPLIPMCLKTPIRRAAKNWRVTHRLALAVQLDEMAESEQFQDIGAMPSNAEPQPDVSLKDLADPKSKPNGFVDHVGDFPEDDPEALAAEFEKDQAEFEKTQQKELI